LVSVIVPAWNAETTLLETLQSAGSQTHRNLEILIVEDGATDRTAELAASYCAGDRRARLIRKDNGGLASARNCGIDEAQGEFIAPLDADDVWHPEKIERQLQTFRAQSPETGLVYCWYRMIDEQGLVTEKPWAPEFEGDVFARHLRCSFGTGSSPLIRRTALGDLRYSTELSRPLDGGSEDWHLQLQLASRFKFACTRAFLLGYRQRSDSMTADTSRMMRAHIHMYEIIRRDFPRREARSVRRELARWHARQGIAQLGKRPVSGLGEIAGALVRAPLIAGRTIAVSFLDALRTPRRLDAHYSVGKPFLSLSPDVP
jgi:glycosyltransferase involved in cell wall biosynthesis